MLDRGPLSTLRTLASQALRLASLRAPAEPAAPLTPLAFLGAALVFLGCGIGLDALYAEPPRVLYTWALGERSFPVLLALLGGGLIAAATSRPPVWLRVAALVLLASLPAQLAWTLAVPQWPFEYGFGTAEAVLVGYAGLVVLRLGHWAAGGQRHLVAAAASASTLPMLALAIVVLPGPSWFYSEPDQDAPPERVQPRDYSAEVLLYAQPAMLQQALDALAPQRPDRIDLYAIGFAGDGSESVFRNEVEFFDQLLSERFANPHRSLRLINHPGTRDRDPLASRFNLWRALHGLAGRMDPDQDILLLFLTSHGSEEHELLVQLDDLPLDPIRPRDLRQALDAAGIRWRVVIVNACYAGGYIEVLEDPQTLILTAARADRSSFGCGADSEITWFGRALLAEALNQTLDFEQAFAQARRAIRAREREQGVRASHPQIRAGEAIVAQLARWRQELEPGPGPAVVFVPAVALRSADDAR